MSFLDEELEKRYLDRGNDFCKGFEVGGSRIYNGNCLEVGVVGV